MNASVNTDTGELVTETAAPDQALVSAITKAEIDQAIIAAHARPRSATKFMLECTELVTLNTEVADECIYAIPRDNKMIEGPSARFAEIVAYSWRNNRSGARVTDEGRDFITAQGVFQDLEHNTYITYEVRRRITGKYGRYNADMIGVTGNAACAIALRNAVLKGVPKALWNPIYEKAHKIIAGDARTIQSRRSEALAALGKQGVTTKRIFEFLQVKGEEDLTIDHIAQLRGIHNAIKEGEISIESAFKSEEPVVAGTRVDAAKEALRTAAAGAQSGADPKADAKAADATPAKAANNYVPYYSDDTAAFDLRAAATLKALELIKTKVWTDYAASSRQIPNAIHAAYTEKKEALAEKETKL